MWMEFLEASWKNIPVGHADEILSYKVGCKREQVSTGSILE